MVGEVCAVFARDGLFPSAAADSGMKSRRSADALSHHRRIALDTHPLGNRIPQFPCYLALAGKIAPVGAFAAVLQGLKDGALVKCPFLVDHPPLHRGADPQDFLPVQR